MAHQLHYTSAATGLAGRPGFQFVAASPAADAAVQQAVTPYLSYQPPPGAPSQPAPDQLAEFPVAFAFARDGEAAILVQCRYLGTDYSGRYGNFLGHAVVLGGPELAGQPAPPITLWGSPLWAHTPATGPRLPELTTLPPGADTGRQAVARWLAGTGPGGYGRLAELVEAALASLDGAAGQVVLVADADQTVARWIAAISYSVPPQAAWRLSFTTYTADPDHARTHLVGTTPAAHGGGDGQGHGLGRTVRLDQPPPAQPLAAQPLPSQSLPAQPLGTGRYATAVAAAWQRGDLAGIDALHELVARTGLPERDPAAALAELARGDRLPAAEQDAAAALLHRYADRLPEPVWSGLDRDDLGRELAFAVAELARRSGRNAVAERAAATAAGLSIAEPAHRGRLRGVRVSPAHAARVAPAVDAAVRAASDLAELAEVLATARRIGAPVDSDAVRTGASAAAGAGTGDLAAVRAAAGRFGQAHTAAVLDGAVAGLAHASPAVIARVLTGDACDQLADRDWQAAPRVGAHVLTSYGRRHPDQRVGVTLTLLGLADQLPQAEAEKLIGEVWRDPAPTIAECLRLVSGPAMLTAQQARRPSVVALIRHALATGELASEPARELAHRVRELLRERPDHPAVADAEAVLASCQIAAGEPGGYIALAQVSGADKRVLARAVRLAESRFPTASPTLQVRVLHDLPDRDLRRRLAGTLTRRVRRPGDPGWVSFAEVAIRLWRAGRPEPTLAKWTVKWASQPGDRAKLRKALEARHPDLPRLLAKMCDEYRPPARAGRLGRLFGRG